MKWGGGGGGEKGRVEWGRCREGAGEVAGGG